MEKIILASSSPRRRDILRLLKIPFEAVPVDIDEKITKKSVSLQTIKLSKSKVMKIIDSPAYNSFNWILGGDTLIEFDNRIIGKPENKTEAFNLLSSFSGRKHRVFTGLSFFSRKNNRISSLWCKTEVIFSRISEKEINWYINTGEWKDAAGGYKIQKLGACLIKKIIGSYSNVMGLPIHRFYGMLRACNYPILNG